MMQVSFPVPATFATWLWFAMGFTFGRSFGKMLDQEIQETDWFKSQSRLRRWVIKRVLDFTHHWWIGGLLMVLAPLVMWNPMLSEVLFWFGAGLFVDDLPDIPSRMREIFEGYANWWNRR